ncbi:SDR family oxidoreductase [Sulfitobacter mediterraneus]|uniref:SDR family NAD(P)-dependent oxidoreductase n=1 Tax=Sulfitobacter mediterraneus TaxID=83219 RepID=UPI0019328186|nr:SDR family NAD(P)-dependent oxidoreductase [Sulfitobacter mediterraneus]MBM1309857.1 SDR family oxidoreductase [Sulfitobacter mediterraneus]MBM1313742.1 SDR family oxidoreductase [Sulfitobacter mediterraneus]MBM1322126.1 SDR family oxidoreductase [Sulfitobacter mediterraneus]MBM1326013.1 SDR family oxidoreductase [Sulfitobacter mediterraneus]MBM1397359.1 SDR family oxidoreductase [Sulfitobacter mediterraneus]
MRRILITGGGSGIGRAIAQYFADQGDDVTIAGRRMDALAETDGGRGMTCKQVDVTDEASVKALFDKPYDVVIANAGAGTAMRVADMPLEVWQSTLAVNLTGVFLTFREALNGMTAGGRLIAIASTASLKGGANIASYAAAKHGVLGLVRSLAVELAREGITCNAVCPGFVDTDMGQAAVTGVMERMNIPREKAEKMVVGGNPMRRMINTDEVVAAVQFLASPEASMVNGHALSVSGGEI